MEIANKHSIKNSQPWLWLTWPLVILLVIAGAVGHFVKDFYHLDSPLLAAQFIGQDLIALVVTIPVLVFSAILVGRGSPRALLVWLGTLIYLHQCARPFGVCRNVIGHDCAGPAYLPLKECLH
jgi:hypothetical protein